MYIFTGIQGDALKIQLRSFDNAQNIQEELKWKMQTMENSDVRSYLKACFQFQKQ